MLRSPSPESPLRTLIHLEVSVLGPEDGWKFVESRLSAAGYGQSPGEKPSLAKSTIDRYMQERVTGRGATSIRELERICNVVFDEVRRRHGTEIVFADFQNYYLRFGVV